jgi:hypothetical protein
MMSAGTQRSYETKGSTGQYRVLGDKGITGLLSIRYNGINKA